MNSLAGIEIVAVSIPADWRSEIIQAAERGQIDQLQQQVLCNGGYFDAQGNPDGLVISGSVEQPIRRGRLRNEPPYSGFLWADTAGTVHIAKTNEAPRDVAWAIQAGPMLVENGQSGINRSTSAACRTVVGVIRQRVMVFRTGRIGLKELADWLVTAGVDNAINLDGGPSSEVQISIGDTVINRPAMVREKIPYFVFFRPPVR